MDYQTPGVYVEEIPLFPPSVAPVATAIPAFIGHTAETTTTEGDSLINQPVRITSLLDYEALFGRGFQPATYQVTLDPGNGLAVLGTEPVDGRRYYLYDGLRQYFSNGGGPCYIVSVGDYTQEVISGTPTTGLTGGLAAIRMVDEPTLIVTPDLVSLRQPNGSVDFANIGTFQAEVLSQCADLQDRFAIFDLAAGQLPPNDAAAPVNAFRNNVGTENLKYGSAYYPWMYSTFAQSLRFTQLQFFDDSAPPVAIPDVDIDNLGTEAQRALLSNLRRELAEEDRVFATITSPTIDRNKYSPLADRFAELLAAVNVAENAATARPAYSALMTFVRDLAQAAEELEGNPDNSAELNAAIDSWRTNTNLVTQLTNLIEYEKNEGVRNSIANGRTEGNVDTDYGDVDSTDYLGGTATNTIGPSGDDFTDGGGNSIAQTAIAAANSPTLFTAFRAFAEVFTQLGDLVIFRTNLAENALFAGHPFFTGLRERIFRQMSILPPAAAVAGVYAATDRNRGVWKAPANVGLRTVLGPVVKLTDATQGSLNVHESGKSVNAIRAFAGKGSLVWGARTLAGNDNEWRYVNVRRFFIFVEESVQKATEPFVFEPNDANTWTRVRAMIENFLTLQWRQGALAGPTPSQAFFVKVGLGQTMTTDDILNGRMIVEIGMAAVRPAEFIILRFSHKMQEA